jgi:hypothetical protein
MMSFFGPDSRTETLCSHTQYICRLRLFLIESIFSRGPSFYAWVV